VAHTTIDVTIVPSQPGLAFHVATDSQFTVPYNGAEVPTAFLATLDNLGPAADTYNIAVTGLPGGFALLNSGTRVTVPAREVGVLGLYLQPVAGQALPAPGAQLSFSVKATSASDPSISQTQIVQFTMPALDAIALAATPATVNTTPGAPVSSSITITNVGNV